MLVTVVTLVTIENVYYIIITSVEPHNGNCGDIHNFFAFLTILLFLVTVVLNLNPGGGSCGSHVVPPPPPVPPSPLMPSAAQGVGSPSGGRAHRGGDLPWPSTTSLSVASISAEEKNSPLPDSCLPLPGCNNPKYCVGGQPHVTFSAPGGATPTQEEIEWVTRR